MRYLSLFSGIEAASVAWENLGWEAVAFSEIEPFSCEVLKHHYPGVPNLGDITKITREQIEDLGQIDVAVFGFPCQDLSVAGKRKGLKDADGEKTRSGLFFDAMRVVEWSRARWAVAENVPGLFSSHGGRDFACVVGKMAGMEVDVPDGGWQNTGVAAGPLGLVEWAVLDAQWFGVPQRRRRVFLVRDTGDWQSRPPLLFIADSLSGDPPPRREAWEGTSHAVAPSSGASGRGFERAGESRGQDPVVCGSVSAFGGNNTAGPIDVATACNSHGGPNGRLDFESETFVTVGPLACNSGPRSHDSGNFHCNQAVDAGHIITHTLRAEHDASEDGTGRGTPPVAMVNMQGSKSNAVSQEDGPSFTLNAMHGHDIHAICPSLNASGAGSARPVGKAAEPGFFVNQKSQVRRLTPRECERLQGFPDDYTLIQVRRLTKRTTKTKWAPDGPRYKALGNSMAVPVMRWIGERINRVENL